MNTKIPVVGTIIPVDRYYYVTVRTEAGFYETWLLTENDIERLRTRARKYDGPLPMIEDLPPWKRTILRWLGLR